MTTQAHEIFAAHKPRAGQQVIYEGAVAGEVVRVEGNLCWTKYFAHGETLPFIWCFSDSLNKLHDWPTKAMTNSETAALSKAQSIKEV